MSQREGPGAQPVEHPEDGQAGADGVARLDRDEAPDFSGQVSLLKFCRAVIKFFTVFAIFFLPVLALTPLFRPIDGVASIITTSWIRWIMQIIMSGSISYQMPR